MHQSNFIEFEKFSKSRKIKKPPISTRVVVTCLVKNKIIRNFSTNLHYKDKRIEFQRLIIWALSNNKKIELTNVMDLDIDHRQYEGK